MSAQAITTAIQSIKTDNGYMDFEKLAAVALKTYAENATPEQTEIVIEAMNDFANGYEQSISFA